MHDEPDLKYPGLQVKPVAVGHVAFTGQAMHGVLPVVEYVPVEHATGGSLGHPFSHVAVDDKKQEVHPN